VCLGALLLHAYYRPTSFEVNLIHQSLHQVDAAAMRRLELLYASGVRKLGAAKSGAFVLDHNGHFLIGDTAAVDVNVLARVFVIAMNHAICQGFSQGDFNVNFVSSNTSAFLYENH
jgi:hypothetical protein